jgi:hypothetical protein
MVGLRALTGWAIRIAQMMPAIMRIQILERFMISTSACFLQYR